MPFDALDIAHQVIRELRPLVAAIAASDPDLARQIRKAATSVPLNVSEGRQRAGKDRKHLWRIAAGSAAETVEALHAAVSWGYVDDAAAVAALASLDRVRAMLWRLTH